MGFTSSASGVEATIDALNRGAVRVTTDNRDLTTVAVGGITDQNKSRLIDVLSAAPPENPCFLPTPQEKHPIL